MSASGDLALLSVLCFGAVFVLSIASAGDVLIGAFVVSDALLFIGSRIAYVLEQTR